MIQKLKEWSGVIALVAILALIVVPLFKSSPAVGTAAPSGTISYSTAIASQYGYYVGVYNTATQVIDDAGNWIGSLTGTTATFSGLVQTDGGLTLSYTNSTSTSNTTLTMVAADIANYSTVIMTPNVASVTLTFPASSTLSAFLPTAGDTMKQCWVNATGTAATKITFAAGTGWDFEVSSTTIAAQPISPGNSGCFTIIRKPATASAFDFIAQYQSYYDGD